jgi:Cdc6-like AAA superfamily ATPase
MNATPLLSSLSSKSAMFEEIRNRIGRTAKKQRTSMSALESAYSYNSTDDGGEDWITATMNEGTQKPKATAPVIKATPAKVVAAKPEAASAGATDMSAMIAQALARSKFSVLKGHALPLTPHTTNKSPATGTTVTPPAAPASTVSNKPNPRLKYHIVVLDELDVLLTKVAGATAKSKTGVEALNALFAWPQRSSFNRTNNRVLLIGIANAIDMTHKFLPELTAAGSAPQLLMFTPYDASSISRIIEQRLTDAYIQAIEKAVASGHAEVNKKASQLIAAATSQPIFSPDGLKMLAMRVANSNGDVRRALEVCSTALGASAARFCSIKSDAFPTVPMLEDDAFDPDKSVCTQADSPSTSTPSSASVSPLSVEKRSRGHKICECCNLPWRPQPAADTTATTSASAAAASQYAIGAVDVSRQLASIFGNRHAKALQALPLQAQVLICAARALVARENTRQQVRSSYESVDNRGLLLDDTDGAAEMDLLDPKRKAMALKTRSSISMEDLEGAYHKLCTRMGLTKAPRAEIRDLVERMIGDGLISAAASGARGAGSHLTARAVSASIGAHLHVNVNAADLDAAFAVSPFYASVATYIHAGLA